MVSDVLAQRGGLKTEVEGFSWWTPVAVITGTVSVSLTVSGPGGSDTEVKEGYITVRERSHVYLPLVLRGTG